MFSILSSRAMLTSISTNLTCLHQVQNKRKTIKQTTCNHPPSCKTFSQDFETSPDLPRRFAPGREDIFFRNDPGASLLRAPIILVARRQAVLALVSPLHPALAFTADYNVSARPLALSPAETNFSSTLVLRFPFSTCFSSSMSMTVLLMSKFEKLVPLVLQSSLPSQPLISIGLLPSFRCFLLQGVHDVCAPCYVGGGYDV